MAFDDNTFRDLLTLSLGFDTISSRVCGVARLLLAREFSALLLAGGEPEGGHFAILDALPYNNFDVTTDLPNVDAVDSSNRPIGKEVPSARGALVSAWAYLGWRRVRRWGGPYIPFKGSLEIPSSYRDPQLSSDAALLLAVAGSALAGPLATLRATVQHRIDEQNFWTKQAITEAFVIIQSSVSAAAPVPLNLTRTIPLLVSGYTLTGNVLSVPASGTYGIRAWGSLKSTSTANPLTMQLGLVIDGSESIVTAIRQSADPSVAVGWEVFFPSTTVTTGIELLNASSVAVTVAGELSVRRFS
ncbi:MAG TPA: hypothetical protein VH062_06615 [Polyangiaceae bacterium]|jgi:hypothetical protein|nr:hypothetical protein [Polyangiaceae bacterium]